MGLQVIFILNEMLVAGLNVDFITLSAIFEM